MRRRKDTFVKANSIADIEELLTIAKNQKEYHEDRIRVLRRRIEQVDRSILVVRDDFLSFLKSNGIDTNYPVISEVSSDEIVPDTVPEQSMGAIPIEEAMLPNIPNQTFLITMNLLQKKYSTLQGDIERYTDTLKKKKLHKAQLEGTLESVQKSIEEYMDKITENRVDYNNAVSNLEKIKSLLQSLLDFQYIFTVLPDTYTAESYMNFQDNYFSKYSTLYYDKKNLIKRYSDKMQETYVPTVTDQMEQGFYQTVFNGISLYFGPYDKDLDNLPDKYIDALPQKKDILKKLGTFSDDLNKLISNVKISLDSIRGVKGVGNSVVDGLVSSTNELSKSFAAQKKLEHTTLEEVSNNNYTVNLTVNQNIQTIKDKLQRGVENLDESFMKTSNRFLRKIALTIGFPAKYIYDRNTNLEDHVRKKVRHKFGGDIPFCDEDVLVNSNGTKTFVKKIDVDPKTGKKKTDVQANLLEKKTRTSTNILSAD